MYESSNFSISSPTHIFHFLKNYTHWVWTGISLNFCQAFKQVYLTSQYDLSVLIQTDLSKNFEFSSKNNNHCSAAQSCLTLCDPMDCSTPGFPLLHCQLELAQTHVHWVDDVIQPSHPLSFSSPPASNLSQHQGLFQWVSSLHQVAKLLELQLQHQSFQWISRLDFL